MSTSLRYTSSDLQGLPDIDGVRYEIIDGDLYVSKQPSWHHQNACSEICTVLRIWSHETGAGSAVQAPGLVFAADDDVAPDVVWISRERYAPARWTMRGTFGSHRSWSSRCCRRAPRSSTAIESSS